MLALALAALVAFQSAEDAGVFVVRAVTAPGEVARETFRLTPTTTGGEVGWTLATVIRFDRGRPIVTLRPILELGSDSLPRALQYEVVDGAGGRRILAQPGPGRFTIREIAPGVERAREVLATGRTVLLDDSVFALYAVAGWHARAEPVTLNAVYPRQGRRETLAAQDLGVRATTLNRDPAQLRLVELRGGRGGPVRLWYDSAARLMKAEAGGLVAERAPDD